MKKSTIPVFFASDDNYASQMAVAIRSIIEKTKCDIDFYIIDSGIIDENKYKIASLIDGTRHNLKFINFDVINTFDGFKQREWISLAAYARLMIPWLEPKIHRAIYIDGDVVVVGDIADLYKESLDGLPLGACEMQELVELLPTIRVGINLSPRHRYFNSGVLLIDCDAWRKDKNLPDSFFDLAKKYPNRFCCDQDLLNKYFENNYKTLATKYNVTINGYTGDDIIVRHFVGKDKPFTQQKKQMTQWTYIWWDFAARTPFFQEFLANYMQYAQKIVNKERPKFLQIIQRKNGRKHLKLFGITILSYGRRRNNRVNNWIHVLADAGYKTIRKSDGVHIDGHGLHIVGLADNTIWTAVSVLVDQEYNFCSNHNQWIVIDIGLNIGITSLWMAEHDFVSRIYSFEPFIPTMVQARANMKRNPKLARKIQLFDFGLSDCDKTVDVSYNPELPGAMSSIPEKNSGNQTEQIRLCSASNILKPIFSERGDKKVMLKIDCEGGERTILPDLFNAGLLQQADIIIMEYHDGYYIPLVELLQDAGMAVEITKQYKDGTGMITATRD